MSQQVCPAPSAVDHLEKEKEKENEEEMKEFVVVEKKMMFESRQ